MKSLVVFLLLTSPALAQQMICEGGVCRLVPNQPVRNVVRVVTAPAANTVRYVRQNQPVRSLLIPTATSEVRMISVPAASPDCTCENCMCGLTSVVQGQQYGTQPVLVYTSAPAMTTRQIYRGPVRRVFARGPIRSFFRRLFRL